VKREMRFRNCDKGGALGLVGAAFHAKQCNALHSCFTESQSCSGASVLVEGMVQYMVLPAVRCEEPCVDACSSDATFRSTRDTHSTSAAPHLHRKSTAVRHV